MIYKKEALLHQKNRESPPQMILFHSSFFTYLTNYFGKIFIFYKKVVSLHSKI